MNHMEKNVEKWERIHTHMLTILGKSLGESMLKDVIRAKPEDFDRGNVRNSIKNTLSKIYVALGEEMTYNLLTNTVLAEVGNDREFLEECYNLIKEVSQ
ncbi:MAG: hypothetical protein ACP5LE_03270 [Thermoplasmata archaeon]